MPVERLRYVAFSHVEADECGSLNEWLAAAPRAEPLCGEIAAMLSWPTSPNGRRALSRTARCLAGRHAVRWFDTPHCLTVGSPAF